MGFAEDIEAILEAAGVADGPTANRLARLSAGRPGVARTMAAAPDAVATRDEIARILLDLAVAPIAARLAAARDLTARAADLARSMERPAAGVTPSDGPGAGPRRGSRRSVVRPAADSEPALSAEPTAEGDDEAGGESVSATAADRRRAMQSLIAVWRDVVRDLALVRLGEERRVRDPALLDDLRAAAGRPVAPTVDDLAAALGRLDDAGELIEGNVRPELVLDSLLLAWPAIPAR